MSADRTQQALTADERERLVRSIMADPHPQVHWERWEAESIVDAFVEIGTEFSFYDGFDCLPPASA